MSDPWDALRQKPQGMPAATVPPAPSGPQAAGVPDPWNALRQKPAGSQDQQHLIPEPSPDLPAAVRVPIQVGKGFVEAGGRALEGGVMAPVHAVQAVTKLATDPQYRKQSWQGISTVMGDLTDPQKLGAIAQQIGTQWWNQAKANPAEFAGGAAFNVLTLLSPAKIAQLLKLGKVAEAKEIEQTVAAVQHAHQAQTAEPVFNAQGVWQGHQVRRPEGSFPRSPLPSIPEVPGAATPPVGSLSGVRQPTVTTEITQTRPPVAGMIQQHLPSSPMVGRGPVEVQRAEQLLAGHRSRPAVGLTKFPDESVMTIEQQRAMRVLGPRKPVLSLRAPEVTQTVTRHGEIPITVKPPTFADSLARVRDQAIADAKKEKPVLDKGPVRGVRVKQIPPVETVSHGPVKVDEIVVTGDGIRLAKAPVRNIPTEATTQGIRGIVGAGEIAGAVQDISALGAPAGLTGAIKHALTSIDHGITSSAYLSTDFQDLWRLAESEQRLGREWTQHVAKEINRWLPENVKKNLAQAVEHPDRVFGEDVARAKGVWNRLFDTTYQIAKRAGIEENYVENYWTHIFTDTPEQIRTALGKWWQREAEAGGVPPQVGNMKSLGGFFQFSLPRVLQTLEHAEELGLHPIRDPAKVIQAHFSALSTAVAKRRLIDRLKEMPFPLVGKPGEEIGWAPALVKGSDLQSQKLNPFNYVPVNERHLQGSMIRKELARPFGAYLDSIARDVHGDTGNRWLRTFNSTVVSMVMLLPTSHGATLAKRALTLRGNNPLRHLVQYWSGIGTEAKADAIAHGLLMEIPSDIRRGLVEKIPGAGPIFKGFHGILWDHITPALQYGIYETVSKRLSANPRLMREAVAAGLDPARAKEFVAGRAKRLAAQQANLMMGKFLEQEFPKLLREYGQLMMFSRSYTFSKARQFAEVFGKSLGQEMTMTPGERAAITQINRESFAISAGLQFTLANAGQWARTGTLAINNDPGHKSDIWAGRYDDSGKKIYHRYNFWHSDPLVLADDLSNTVYDLARRGLGDESASADFNRDVQTMKGFARNRTAPILRTTYDLLTKRSVTPEVLAQEGSSFFPLSIAGYTLGSGFETPDIEQMLGTSTFSGTERPETPLHESIGTLLGGNR